MRKALTLCFALLSMAALAHAADPAPYDWGPVVKTFEVSSHGDYKGTFTRRGTSNVYDAVWVFIPTGEKIVDVLEVRGIVKGELIVYRRGNAGTYSIPITNGVMGRGKASWVSDPAYFIEAVSIPAASSPSVAAAPAAPAPTKTATKDRWIVKKAKNGQAWGYDAASVREGSAAGRKILSWVAYTPRPAQAEGGAWTYALTELEFDCAAKASSPLTMATFDQNGKAIDVLTAGDDQRAWKPTKGLEAILQNIACNNGTLENAREIGDFDALFKGLRETAQS